MSQSDFDFGKRNLVLIQRLMNILGVSDCEDLPNKVIELKRAAEHRNEAEGEQSCPMCDGKGFNRDFGRVVWCEVCYGTGQV